MKLSLANRTHALLVLSGALATLVIGIGVFFSYSLPAPLEPQQPAAMTLADVANTYIQKYGIHFGKEAPLLTTFTCAEGASDPLIATTTVGFLCQTVDMSTFRDKTKLTLAWKKDTVSLHTFTQWIAGNIVAGLEKKDSGVGSTYACDKDVTVSTPLSGTRRDCTLSLKDSTERYFSVFFFRTGYSFDTSYVLYTYNPLIQNKATYATIVGADFTKIVAGLSDTQNVSWLKYFAETAYAQDGPAGGETAGGDVGNPAIGDFGTNIEFVAGEISCPTEKTLVTTYDCNVLRYIPGSSEATPIAQTDFLARYSSMKHAEAAILCDRAYVASDFYGAQYHQGGSYDVISHGVTAAPYTPYSCVASCALPTNLGGGTLADGGTVTAYEEYSVASPGTCSSQVRTCTDGVLSGTYDQLSCAVTTKGSCGNSGANVCTAGNPVSSSGNALDGYTWYCDGTPSIATYRSAQCSYKPVVATWSPAPDCAASPACGDKAYITTGSCSTGNPSDCTGAQPTRSCSAGATCAGPSASLSVSPTTINYSESATLSYGSALVSGSCTIDNGVGTIPPNSDGTKVVRPLSDTTYTLSCSGAEAKRATVLVAAGLISVNSPTCTIPPNSSTCSAALTWSSHHFSAPSISSTSYTSPNGTAQPVTLTGPGTVTYALRNGSFTMDSKTVTASCAPDSSWDSAKGVCAPASNCVANTGALCASDANSCDQTTSGTIGCNGVCSAVTPSDARCSGTPPLGIIDSVTSGVSCGLAKGWAYDPDSSSRSIDVHLYVDGPAGSGTGYNAGATSEDSTDVNNYFGIASGMHRFAYQLPQLPAGPHTVHAYSIGVNSSGVKDNQNPEMGESPKTFTCDPATYTLTVITAGTGTGNVVSSIGGRVSGSCNSTCSDAYTSGTEVSLKPTPVTGSTFTGWSGACSGTGTCNVTMTAARSVTATFTKIGDIGVTISATPAGPLTAPGATNLSWVTTGNPESCDASGADWSGTDIANGERVTQRSGMPAGTYDFGIVCHKVGTPDARSSVRVVVNPVPTYSCTGTQPTPVTGMTVSTVAPTVDTPWSYNSSGAACTWKCNTGYKQSGSTCVASPKSPDLTAGSITPTSASKGASTLYSATISNIGDGSTGSGFPNLFQKATDAMGTGATDIDTSVSATLSAGGSVQTSFLTTFPVAGTYYLRACADKNSAGHRGTITESNEDNNCGAWTPITIATVCSANKGNDCKSAANTCGQTNPGTYGCDGVCSATTPPDSSCGGGASCTGTLPPGTKAWNDTAPTSDTAYAWSATDGICTFKCTSGTWNEKTNSCVAGSRTGGCVAPKELVNGVCKLPACNDYTSSCLSNPNSCGQQGSGQETLNCKGVTTKACDASTPADPPVTATISATPNRVKAPGTVTVSWITSGANSCTIKKNGAWMKDISSSSCALSDSLTDTTVTTQTIYSIFCSNATNQITASSNIVNVVPKYQEF